MSCREAEHPWDRGRNRRGTRTRGRRRGREALLRGGAKSQGLDRPSTIARLLFQSRIRRPGRRRRGEPHRDRKFKTWRSTPGAQDLALYTEIFEADKVINVPIAKHHGLASSRCHEELMGMMGAPKDDPQKLDESLVTLP